MEGSVAGSMDVMGLVADNGLVTIRQSEMEEIKSLSTRTAEATNIVFLITMGALVFLMQGGFAMLEAGSVRTKNTKNVLLKNALDACLGVMGFYLFGFAFCCGSSNNVFIGVGDFALSGTSEDPLRLARFFFSWTFAATSSTIVSGSVAERTSFHAYLMYTFLLTSFVYPVVAHWVWNTGGWLRSSAFATGRLFGSGMVDYAGSGTVHAVGGFAGLCGAVIVGARKGRFSDGRVNPMPGHSATLVTLGSFLLWFGWYGFNAGSALQAVSIDDVGNPGASIQVAVVNTTISAAAGGMTVLLLVKFRDGVYDLISSLNGLLAGLVSITAGCALVEPYMALVIGIIGACVYTLMSWILLLLGIDDPLDAFPVHGGCGVWGVIAVGLFARAHLLANGTYQSEHYGLFYGGGGRLLAAQIVGILAIVTWTVVTIGLFFLIVRRLRLLRISEEEEMRGNDQIKHGGGAYPEMKNMDQRRRVPRENDEIVVESQEYSDEGASKAEPGNHLDEEGHQFIVNVE